MTRRTAEDCDRLIEAIRYPNREPETVQTIVLLLKVEFYFGIKEIAKFLGINETTCKRKLQSGKLPGKKDGMGRWVLCNLDYYQSLQG